MCFIIISEDQMRRFYFKPLLDFADPFFFPRRFATPSWNIKIRNLPNERQVHEQQQQAVDPHSTFERFFKQHEVKNESEKEFFKKHYPEKVVEKFDPYKVLQIKNDASLQEVKEAYRTLAIKYHPKNNSASDAPAKFEEVAKAYQTIIQSKKNRAYEDFGFGSFFEDFQKQIDNILGKVEEAKPSKQAKTAEAQNKFGELYSESSNYESVNGKQTKYIIEKVYKKDGQLLTVKREEKLKDDGKVQITETIDNGKQVKKKTYIQENDVKKLSS